MLTETNESTLIKSNKKSSAKVRHAFETDLKLTQLRPNFQCNFPQSAKVRHIWDVVWKRLLWDTVETNILCKLQPLHHINTIYFETHLRCMRPMWNLFESVSQMSFIAHWVFEEKSSSQSVMKLIWDIATNRFHMGFMHLKWVSK